MQHDEDEKEFEWVDMPYFPNKYIKLNGYFFPTLLKNTLKRCLNFKYESGDIIVASYPKSGTTWTQEIVFSIVNECNFELAKSAPIDERVPFLESPTKKAIDLIYEMKQRPRLIKTHLPLSLLPVGIEKHCKVRIGYARFKII